MELLQILEKTRNQRIEAEIKEREAFKPLLRDRGNLLKVYGWFLEISKELECFPPVGSNAHLQRFIFIALMLYYPRSLFGQKMPNGLARDIARVYDLKASKKISENTPFILLYINRYKDFCNHVEYLYVEILTRVNLYGLK